MIILHGEHTLKSREKLTTLLAEAAEAGFSTVRLTAKNLSVAELEEHLGRESLFGSPEVLVIEELHSLPTSARKKELQGLLAAARKDTLDGIDPLILWEKRALTKTMLKPFKAAQVEEFKLSKKLFGWLDSIGKKRGAALLTDLHKVYETDDAGLVLAMLMRQVRLLLGAKDDGKLKGAPFMITKLKSQAKQFSTDELVRLHTKLLEIDKNLKTSGTPLTLQQQLDLLVLQL